MLTPPTTDPVMEAFMEALHLHDLMADYLPDTPPNTYQRGRHKIDHIFGTISVLTAMTGAGIIPFGHGPKSDHASIYADFSLATLCSLPSHSLLKIYWNALPYCYPAATEPPNAPRRTKGS